MLSSAGIETVEQLLSYQPFRYEDRTNFRPIRGLKEGESVVLEATVVASGKFTTRMRRVRIFELLAQDDSGSLPVKFFNQPYLEKVLKKDTRVILFGIPRSDEYSGGLSMINPEFEIIGEGDQTSIHTGRIVPVYRKIGRLNTRMLRQIVFQALSDVKEDETQDPLPPELLKRHRFPKRFEALRMVHFPEDSGKKSRERFIETLESRETLAQQRLIFEEFFLFQLGLKVVKRRRREVAKERKVQLLPRVREVIKAVLPFRPTGAQKRVLKEIVEDLVSSKPMSRLVQGDVGSGKTIVAVQAVIVMIENGFQTVIMAPTEILAEQHFKTTSAYLRGTGYQVALLSGRIKGRQRKEILSTIASGEVQLVIGTHAVFQKGVEFKDLGLVVIDEQHRFGVMQRSRLMEKGGRPDTLVMTATPIPRSLALTLYGDLDLSTIDELPPGRQAVTTLVETGGRREKVYQAVRRQLQQGRQVFVVYPLIEESEKLELRAATEMSQKLQAEVFPEFQVGLIHGRLKPEEKEELMSGFERGEIQILVSTTVVEVGIDVPNATVMIVEHADRFGLSQLHQLRGRIGRGEHAGYCVLMTDGPRSQEAVARLEIMRQTNDGFKIAEKDLEIRGPGDFLGTRQSGIPVFRFGNIVRDREWLSLAETEAGAYLEKLKKTQGGLTDAQLQAIGERWRDRFGLYEVG
jgi:ATP-dependent DNA helicase RecG